MAGSYLRQSTASQSRGTPPLLDDTDFKTAKTALTIANTDVKLIVNGGASADKNSGGGTHRANGVYGLTFDATDTATVGEMEVSIKVAGALPVFMKFWVLEEAVYDALFAASAPGYLQPTTAGRTLDVSVGGEAGVDWANVGSPTTALALTGTTIATTQKVDVETIKTQSVTCAAGVTVGAFVGQGTAAVGVNASGHVSRVVLVDTLTTYTGDTPQTGDSFARIGVAGAGLTAIDLPNQTMDIIGNITGNLSGSVGSVTGAVGSVTGNVGGNVTGSVGSIATGGIAAASFAAGAIDAAAIATDAIGAVELAAGAASEIATAVRTELTTELGRIDVASSTLATQASVNTIDDFLDTEIAAILAAVDTEIAAIKVTTDKLDDTLETDPTGTAGVYRFTVNAVESVWDAVIAAHLQSGTTGSALNAAGSAGDPWTTTLPGAYGAGTAGFIIGTNLDGTVSSRATQASVDTIDDFLDTEIAAIKTKTDQLTFTTANRVDSQVFGMQANTLTASALAADAVTEIQTGLSTHSAADVWAVATRVLTAGTNIVLAKGVGVTGFNDLSAAQVNTEADTALADVGLTTTVTGRIDAAITTRASQASLDTVDDFLDTEVAAIKAKTDNLPSDPADASDIVGSFATIASTLAVLNGKLDTIDDFLDTEIAAIKAVTDQLTAAQAEPVAVPAANASPLAKIAWLAMLARNKVNQTATQQTVRNDGDSATVGTATVSDDGTTFARGKFS